MKFLFDLLNLDKKQKDKLQLWLVGLPEHDVPDDETVTMDGNLVVLKGFDTGIGPVFWVETKIGELTYKCYLNYDDNGELL